MLSAKGEFEDHHKMRTFQPPRADHRRACLKLLSFPFARMRWPRDCLAFRRRLTAHGHIKSDGKRLVGIFDVDGSPRHLAIEVETPDQSLECSNVTLTYSNADRLVGHCQWSGKIGKKSFRMDLGGGVFIAGPLDTARTLSTSIRGSGTWQTGTADSLDPARDASASGAPEVPSAFNAVEYPDKLTRERLLLESGAPIVVCMTSRMCCSHKNLMRSAAS